MRSSVQGLNGVQILQSILLFTCTRFFIMQVIGPGMDQFVLGIEKLLTVPLYQLQIDTTACKLLPILHSIGGFCMLSGSTAFYKMVYSTPISFQNYCTCTCTCTCTCICICTCIRICTCTCTCTHKNQRYY